MTIWQAALASYLVLLIVAALAAIVILAGMTR